MYQLVNTDAPIVNVLHSTIVNDLGAPYQITWTREDTGRYSAGLPDQCGALNTETWGGYNSSNLPVTYMPLYEEGDIAPTGYWSLINSDGTIKVQVLDATGTRTDLADLVGPNAVLTIKFRIHNTIPGYTN